MSMVKGSNPWGSHWTDRGFAGWATRHRKNEIRVKSGPMIHAGVRIKGLPPGINRTRFAAGDPSWLSQFVKHNAGLAKSIVGIVGTAAGSIVGNPELGALAAGFVDKRINMSPGGPRLSGNPSTAAFGMSQYQYRPAATRGTGKAAGMTAALAPMPPSMNFFGQSINPMSFLDPQYDPSGGGADPNADPNAQDPGTVMTAIPSAGGGSMLYHHFFGKSNSKAIPVSQTNGMRPSGYHINKHGYYLASIATWLPPGTVWVKGRRRNPLNPRALHRSIARLVSAKHAVKKLGMLEVPHRRKKARAFLVPKGRSVKMLKA